MCFSMSWDSISQKHKGFAFVEYEVPEAAQLALEQMNGVLIGGRNIKVGRPSQMPQAQREVDEIVMESKRYNRLYVSSIHTDLSEEDVRNVFEAFGRITSCRLASSTTRGKHKGYGFIEYETSTAAEEAIASMNLFDLGGQFLRVGKACTPPDSLTALNPMAPTGTAMPTAAAVAAAAATAKIQAMDAVASNAMAIAGSALPQLGSNVYPSNNSNMLPPPGVYGGDSHIPPPGVVTPVIGGAPIPTGNELDRRAEAKHQDELAKKLIDNNEELQTLQQQEDLSIKGQSTRHMVMQRLMRSSQSPVVILRNMVGVEDVDEMLQDEITEECSKYGMVNRVLIYQEKQSEEENAVVIVKIFVEFNTAKEAEDCISALNGRYFGGRVVRAESYDKIMYDQNDLSG